MVFDALQMVLFIRGGLVDLWVAGTFVAAFPSFAESMFQNLKQMKATL